MARRRGGAERRPKASRTPKAQQRTEGIDVRAVKTTQGRAATTVHVELDPERLPGAAPPQAVEEVVAQLPSDDADGGPVRWDDQPLQAGEESHEQGKRKLHYSGTRYEGSDAARYGIKVRVRTKEGQISTDACGTVRQPDDPD